MSWLREVQRHGLQVEEVDYFGSEIRGFSRTHAEPKTTNLVNDSGH